MNITLANGTKLSPIIVTGERRYVKEYIRDVLTFVFPVTESMDTLDTIFNEENCSVIEIDGTEYTNYTVRVELKKETVVVTEATDTTDAVREDRIFVSMGQLTYNERQTQNNLKMAVINGIITKEQYTEITGEKYS